MPISPRGARLFGAPSFVTPLIILAGLALGLLLPRPSAAWNQLYVNGACEQSGQTCRATITNAGGNNGCCDPQAPDVSICVTQRSCRGIYGYRWANNQVSWTFNPNGMAGKSAFSKLSQNVLEDTFKKAFDEWAKPACSGLKVTYTGVSSTKPNPFDKKVVLYLPTDTEWAQLGLSKSVLAFANPTPDDKGVLQDGDILFNPKPGQVWGADPNVERRELDLTDTALHEIGHSLGLGHSHVSTAVMYYALRGQGPIYKGLSQDEIDAVCTIYPTANTCSSSSECGSCRSCSGGTCQPSNPLASTTCKACKADADCGNQGKCVDGPAGKRCLQTCTGNCCPQGYRCIVSGADRLCTPETSVCPEIKCSKNEDCGANGNCLSDKCQPPNPPYDTQQCHKSCSSDGDCNANHKCVERIPGQKYCAPLCSAGQLCPSGLHCRPAVNGINVCLPVNPFFCPCSNNGQCPFGQVCDNNICKTSGGEVLFAPCTESAACQKGLQCLRTTSGSRCVKTCNPGTCPNGTLCAPATSGVSICLGAKDRDIGQSCDGLQFRCKDNRTCIRLSRQALSGYCVETCSLSQGCTSGGACNLQSSLFRYCECGDNDNCGQGRTCQTVGKAPFTFKQCVCTSPPCNDLCNNQTCDADKGENCSNCPNDCPCRLTESCVKGVCTDPSTTCGNGTCDPSENCGTCAQDCPCPQGEVCQNNQCGKPSENCGDGTCDTNENCSTCPTDCVCPSGTACNQGACNAVSKCGDGSCDSGENCSSCAQDCACPTGQSCQSGVCQPSGSTCGNVVCDPDEDCSTCPEDCGCPSGQVCRSGSCVINDGRDVCGNNKCEINVGENCTTCPSDCGCPSKHVCQAGICRPADSLCRPEQQTETCDPATGQCTVECNQEGCSCDQNQAPTNPTTLFILGFGLFLLLRRRRAHS
ncbi:MAG: matrixin family metalloprotease [Deltaproteobacteria bacterium]|nr:MAG: matrixin family metalloprotease [Deltaproteobacteria bacterium]